MLGENLKRVISESKFTNEEVSEMMGISKGNLYNLFKKDTFEVKYVRKASEVLGIPMSKILDQEVKSDNTETTSFGDQVIHQMVKSIEDLKKYFEEEMQLKNRQLEARDRQIEKLLDLLGKLEGATKEPLSNEYFDKKLDTYTDIAYSQVSAKSSILLS